MAYKTNAWTSEHLQKMNAGPFMVDFLDTFKISPLCSETQTAIDALTQAVKRIETAIQR